MGMVTPAREAVITPRVTGAIVEEHEDFEPGGFFSAGEQMLRVDPIDYEQAIEQRRSDVARAEAALQIELGDQALAREELELLDVDVPEINRDLILRIPQVSRARAEVRSAEAALERAELDLARTRIVAPFDGHVVERLVTLGDNVSSGDRLARLVASDEYWIELTLPVSNLRWIDTPAPDRAGSVAHIAFERAWGPGVTRSGVVARRVGELERDSGLARLIVSVDDPLARSAAHAGEPELIVGGFVDVRIEGRALDDCVVIDRNLLRERDVVWIMGPDDRLATRRVDVAHRGPREVYITSGLEEGDRVVRTNLTAPVDGMLLRLAETVPTPDDALAARGGSASGG
ncbi:MAG: efflux RND transporter periplasmic adaptor subunit, partial [Planctomycetota bacterium]